jgi:hypothetical protein
MTPIERLISTAKQELGYLEKNTNSQLDSKTTNAGLNNWTKYARDLDSLGVYDGKKNGYAWCDMFVDWCFIQTFGLESGMQITYQPMKGWGAGCTASAMYYKRNNSFYKTPQIGDQIFFTKDNGKNMYHTGLVIGFDANRVYTIEGNTSSDKGVIENGGSVNSKSYPINYNKIGGYGRPNYSLIAEEDEDMDISRFEELLHEYRKTLQDNDSNTYSEEARNWAVDTGLVAGGSSTEFNGMWQDFLTREQLVTVLYRFAKLMGKA